MIDFPIPNRSNLKLLNLLVHLPEQDNYITSVQEDKLSMKSSKEV